MPFSRFPIVAVFVLMALTLARPAWALTCAAPDRVHVVVSVKDPEPAITSVHSLKQINTKAASHGLLQRGKMVLGLTQSKVSMTMHYQTRVLTQGADVCVNIMRVEAGFGHDMLKVILPREYARGTCQYKEVLKHEMAHVRADRETVRKYAQVLKHDLDRAVARLNPIHVRSKAEAKAIVERELHRVLGEVKARFNTENKRLNAIVDTPGGPYDANGVCRSW